MRNIMIVECGSTGFNFIRDIVNRGYHPVVLQTKLCGSKESENYQKAILGTLDGVSIEYDLLFEKDTYEETLEMVRQYDPLVITPGTEKGVYLANKLAYDLNLQCNPIENLEAMTLKHKMQEKIAEHGLRHIRGRVVKSVEEAIECYDEEGFKEVVVKPLYSAGSVGVRICEDKEEMINSVNLLFNDVNLYGESLNELVVQERIVGEEYFINTVSCNGEHRVTLMWKYSKVKTEEGGHVYDSIDTVNELGIGEAEIVEYAFDVADALGIKYGPIHGEYMVDEDGPVLIEVNCRPSGGNMDAEYLDLISGQHETDSILDAYINPENFIFQRDRGYKLYAHGSLKMFIVPKDVIPESSPMQFISNKLESHYKTSQAMADGTNLFVKTQDFETTGGTVYLVHKDRSVLEKDLDFLRSIEKYAFDLVLSEGLNKETEIKKDIPLDEIASLVKNVRPYGSILLITDQFINEDNIMQIHPHDLGSVEGDFRCVVLNLNRSLIDKKDDFISFQFLRLIKKVKVGGLIFIPESTYQYLPHGRKSVEALIKVRGLKLEFPMHHMKNVVIASKD